MIDGETFTLYAAIFIVVELIAIAAALRAVMTARTSQGAVAWAIALVTFPWITLPLYAVFGGRKFRGYRLARRSGDADIRALARRIEGKFAPVLRPELSEHVLPFAALERLALMPFVGGNDARLLIDGEATFAAILEAIAQARDYVLLEFYIVNDDGIGRALHAALTDCCARGVRVLFIYDSIGSYSLPTSYVESLRDAGARVEPFISSRNPLRRLQLNFRNHRKIVVVDGRIAYVGGHNVGDEYLGRAPELSPWRDTQVEVRGPAAGAVQLAFLEDWNWAAGEIPELHWRAEAIEPRDLPALVVPSGPADELDTCSLFFTHVIGAARRRLWISSPYFVPDEPVLAALQLAALRGVDVRILLPGRPDHRSVYLAGISFLDEMEGAGVRLFRYRRGFLHQKVTLCDDVGIVSTANLDNRSFRLNFEISLLVADARFGAEVAAMLARDFDNSDEIDEQALARISLPVRVASRAARLFAPVL
ncbi:MAG: cardiolipin synthase [Burkholderiales bacterium]|nr:cardiolipin synthase [Burkholderiales bacterium]